jgi:hypothetical protein
MGDLRVLVFRLNATVFESELNELVGIHKAESGLGQPVHVTFLVCQGRGSRCIENVTREGEAE